MSIIHQSPGVSRFFSRILKSGVFPYPILLRGVKESGRSYYIKTFIRECECLGSYKPFYDYDGGVIYENKCTCIRCQRIISSLTPDIIEVNGDDSISEVRLKVLDALDSRAYEMKMKYMLIRNLDRMQKSTMDVLLKVVEEPVEGLRVFGTAGNGIITGALSSRFLEFRLKSWSRDHFELLTNRFEKYKPFKNVLSEFFPSSVFELRYYDSVIKRWVGRLDRVLSVVDLMDSLGELKVELEGMDEGRILLSRILLEYIRKGIERGELFLRQVALMYVSTLFNEIEKSLQYKVSLDNQVFSFLVNMVLSRKLSNGQRV